MRHLTGHPRWINPPPILVVVLARGAVGQTVAPPWLFIQATQAPCRMEVLTKRRTPKTMFCGDGHGHA